MLSFLLIVINLFPTLLSASEPCPFVALGSTSAMADEDGMLLCDENEALLLAAGMLAEADYGPMLEDITFSSAPETAVQRRSRQQGVSSERPIRSSSHGSRPRIQRAAGMVRQEQQQQQDRDE